MVKKSASGALWGFFGGAVAGFGVSIAVTDRAPFFSGDVVVVCAALGFIVGFFVGQPVADWVRDNWRRL